MLSVFHFPVSTAARRLDAQAFASLQRPRAFGVDRFDAPVAAHDHVMPGLPVCATRETVRRALASVGQERSARSHERLDLAHDAITAARAAKPAGVCSELISAHAQRVSIFE